MYIFKIFISPNSEGLAPRRQSSGSVLSEKNPSRSSCEKLDDTHLEFNTMKKLSSSKKKSSFKLKIQDETDPKTSRKTRLSYRLSNRAQSELGHETSVVVRRPSGVSLEDSEVVINFGIKIKDF